MPIPVYQPSPELLAALADLERRAEALQARVIFVSGTAPAIQQARPS